MKCYIKVLRGSLDLILKFILKDQKQHYKSWPDTNFIKDRFDGKHIYKAFYMFEWWQDRLLSADSLDKIVIKIDVLKWDKLEKRKCSLKPLK